jgi:hypothetical protein
VALSGVPSGLGHGGHQMLGSKTRGLLDLEHRRKMQRWSRVCYRTMAAKVSTVQQTRIINALDSSPRGIPRGSIYRGG